MGSMLVWNIMLCVMAMNSFMSHIVKGIKGFTFLCNPLIEPKKMTSYSQRS